LRIKDEDDKQETFIYILLVEIKPVIRRLYGALVESASVAGRQ